MFYGLYSDAPDISDSYSFLDKWVTGPSDPFQSKASALVAFCFPNPSLIAPGSNAAQGYDVLQGILTADSVKHYLGLYKHYQIHWPMMHMSFNPMQAYDGLVLTMICIGAVYSDRLSVEEVRWLMEVVRASVFRSSQVYNVVTQGAQQATDTIHRSTQVEEIQALVHIHSLFVWHGNETQRQQGRDEFWVLAKVVRQFGLLQPLPDRHQHHSTLHQPGPIYGNEVDNWTWNSWVEQEERARLMYIVFLIDSSLTIFFNVQPQFDIYDIKLPLPADDAAWEATSEEACARALGLRGQAAQDTNHAGSRRPKQLEMSEALQFLHKGGDFPQRATNAFSKFVLIHAIHVQIFKIQRQILNINGTPSFPSSGTSTPQSNNEWAPTDGDTSNGSSGYATPVEGMSFQFSQAHQTLRQTVTALDLWKQQWDIDMHIQYPSNQRRVGFCRDGVHYYFLAKLFLRSSRREEWAAPPDVRCQQIFHLLKQIRAHVASDSASKGLGVGSITTVDDSYGMAGLALNMKLLFTPIAAAP
jgi:hypothetical protein